VLGWLDSAVAPWEGVRLRTENRSGEVTTGRDKASPPGGAGSRGSPEEPLALGEPRWPLALAICFVLAIAVVFDIVLPHRQTVGTPWLVPTIGVVLLVALMAAEPGSSSARAMSLRRISIVLIVTLAVAAVYLTCVLAVELLAGEAVTRSADELLAAGTLVWLGNNVVFGLLYWQFDGGGALARARQPRAHPDFAFPQHQNPELAPPGWRPKFGDYLYLGLTNATAFSPTDVMPLASWAKVTMALQSLVSLVVFALVIATAVNVLS
jgi:uncharacterized membrane protein